jgi:beta-lactamase regulating signal transducer with metallopeptidase domain
MTILFAWLWQGLVVAALTGIVLRAMPRLNAATRHLAWWVALIAVLSIPLLLTGTSADIVPGPILASASYSVQAALVLTAPDWVASLVVMTWAAAAAFGVVRIARGCKALRALRRTSIPFDPAREARLPLWCHAGRCASRRVQLRLSHDLAGACAMGFRRPVILIGRRLADALDDLALDQIVMHEQAHLARCDDWLQLLQAGIRTLCGLHPAVWWLSRSIDLDREAACDDAVVARTGETHRYTAALLDAAATAGSPVLAMAPGATARPSALRVRVARLLDPRRAGGARPRRLATLALVFPLGATAASPHLAPLVTFVDAVERALPLVVAVRTDRAPAIAPSISDRSRALIARPLPLHNGRSTPLAIGTAADGRHTASEPAGGPELTTPAAGPAAPIASRRVPGSEDLPLLIAPPANMNRPVLPATQSQEPRVALATAPGSPVTKAAMNLASGARRSGIAIGRAFTRAGHGFAGTF